MPVPARGPVLLFLLVALLVSGCDRPPSEVVSSAAGRLHDSGTARFQLQATLEGDAVQSRSFALDGWLDFQTGSADFAITAGSAPSQGRMVDGRVYWQLSRVDGWVADDDNDRDFVGFLTRLMSRESVLDAPQRPNHVQYLGKESVRGQAAEGYGLRVPAIPFFDPLYVAEAWTANVWVERAGRLVRLVLRSLDAPLAAPGEKNGVILTVTIDFFDFGTPFAVEVPPEDEVVEWREFVASGWDPFAGVECYDDRVDECLDTNPELDAMAADPSLCQGDQARVCLVPIGRVRADIVGAIVDFHRETAGVDIVLLPGLSLDKSLVDPQASQVEENALYNLMKDTYAIDELTPSTYIALTPFDIVPEDGRFGWMFGARFGFEGVLEHGVFSYFRMANVPPADFWTVSDDMLYERAAKYAGRYVALLHFHYPMGDNPNYLNYRHMSGIADLDFMEPNWPEGPRPAEGRLGLQ